MGKPTQPTTVEIRKRNDYVNQLGSYHYTFSDGRLANRDRGILLDSLEAANAEIRESQEAFGEQAKELEMANRVVAEAGRKEYKYQTKLETLEYRHECLKQIHKDSTGILRTSRVDEIIDEYIKWEEDDD